jgi:Ca2+-binding RTX toxin-like protein
MYARSGDDTLHGMGGDDFLFAGVGNDELKGGTGDDRLYGGSGDDLYRFNLSSGRDTILDSGGDDKLIFGAGIDKEALWFSRSGNDLLIDTVGEDGHVAIKSWYRNNRSQIEEISTSVGDVLQNNQVDQLVQAMAAFSPPVSGVLNLSPEEQNQVESVIAVGWQ